MKNKLFYLSEYKETPYLFDFYFKSIYFTLKELDNEYPFFSDWYFDKVKNGIYSSNREIIFNIINDQIAGIAILKNDVSEKKLCTLRVHNKFQRLGIGKQLMAESFELLDTQFPLITVNSRKDHLFKNLFKYYNFKRTNVFDGIYRPYNSEITYNGIL
ncbi:MAG: GNAT family N-acetyltransferase [Spirochaetes bacterium]|nr:GNAT family N-acetyltransferase [Spirochaetota bacterium]